MSYTQAMFFHNNKCCYINTCDVLLYQYIVKNYKQEEKIINILKQILNETSILGI
jgi:hypothetical protein